MKEALTSPYNKIVFREAFNSEQAVRNNGGVPIYDGILDLGQLTQIWSSTRNKI